MDAEDTASPAEFVIYGTKIDFLDTKLSKERSTHNAGFDSDVEDAFSDDGTINSRVRMPLLAIWIEVSLATIFVALIRGL